MLNRIKVFQNGILLFTTDVKSMPNLPQLIEGFKIIDKKFPEDEGFTIEVDALVMNFSRQSWKELVRAIEQGKIRSIEILVAKL